jgi:surface protein
MNKKILIPAILFIIMIGIASAEVIYQEDFEDGTADNWTLPPFIAVNDTSPITGSYDLRMGQYDNGNPDIATYNFTEEQTEAMINKHFILSYKTRWANDVISTPTVNIRDNLGISMIGCSIYVYELSGGKLYCLDNGTLNSYNLTYPNQTYEVKYDVNDLAKTYDVYIDNSLIATLPYDVYSEPIGDMAIIHLNNNDPQQQIDDITINTSSEVCSVCNSTCSPCGGGCNATDLSSMFYGVTNFDTVVGDINGWNTSCITNMNSMFYGSDFAQDISVWDTSSVTDMSYMFYASYDFNQPIGSWDVSQVTDMSWMFANGGHSGFNQNLSAWNTSKVTKMQGTFATINNFNGDITTWDTSSVTDMSYMFYASYDFNQPIGNWDVSKVTDMRWMFYVAFVFNQDLSLWNTSSVTNMDWMFRSANAFNGDIGAWDTSQVTSMNNIFTSLTLPVTIYDSILNGWASRTQQNAVPFDAGNSQYSIAGLSARNDTLIGIYSWVITDGGMECVSNWTCDTYSPCQNNSIMPCLTIVDLNFCGMNFTGNLSDYDDACIYVPPPEVPNDQNSFTGAVVDNGTKIILGFGSIALLFGLLVGGAVIVFAFNKLIKKK